jgi:sulfatase modifying factor 1
VRNIGRIAVLLLAMFFSVGMSGAFSQSTPTRVPMERDSGGTYTIPVMINGRIVLDFIVDSGASDVTIPSDVVGTLMRTGTLQRSDFLGSRTYVLADGSKVPSETFRIRSLKVGTTILENVTGSIADVKAPLLLGQSFLGRFDFWAIDNKSHVLVLGGSVPSVSTTLPKQIGTATGGVKAFRDCPQCPEMVSIPLGSFVMGVAPGEQEREGVPELYRGREIPARVVTISERYSLARYEVTRGQYAAFMAATGHASTSGCWSEIGDGLGSRLQSVPGRSWFNPGFAQTDSDPVVCVSWNDATAYAVWLSRTTGKTYRLPSEAEWEYAARAGSYTARYWGDGRDEACQFENVHDSTAAQSFNWNRSFDFLCADNFRKTAPVGSFKPNKFGLHDMLGNVAEWVEDCWNDNYQGASLTQAARRSGDCIQRVARGGAWNDSRGTPHSVRAAWRAGGTPNHGSIFDGFRVARTN